MQPFTTITSKVIPLPRNNIDTDQIIPARYLKVTDKDGLVEGLFCDWRYRSDGQLDPEFPLNRAECQQAEILLTGDNFGCGSSREHAPIAIKHANIAAVIAGSFARIFYRNSFNMGLPILESEETAADVKTGDELEVDLDRGLIVDLTQGHTYQAEPIPEFMQELLKTGGLIPYIQQKMRQEAENV